MNEVLVKLDEVLAEVKKGRQEVFTATEAAEFLGIGKSGLYQEVNLGRIPVRKYGNKWLFLRDDLLDWVNQGKAYQDPEAV